MKKSKTKIILFFLAFFIVCAIQVKAQERQNKEKMEALKVAFITEKLNLTEVESKTFWPIYNDYQKDRKSLRSETSMGKERANFDEMSDIEIESFINNKLKMEERSLTLKKKYYEKIKTILPIKKVAQLSQIEKQFRQEVLKRLKDKK